jgi:2-oxoglutarate ferredoxin oxidoreductase subunit beta
MKEALAKRGFCFIEVISPCPTAYGRRNKLGVGLDEMKFYKDHSIIKHGSDPKEADIGLGSDIIVGKFVDIERPTYAETLEAGLQRTLEIDLHHKLKRTRVRRGRIHDAD